LPKRYTATDFDRGRVAAMAGAGMQETRIAEHLRIDPKTLRRHFRNELDNALTNRVTDIADNLAAIALSPKRGMPQVVASLFILKCLGKWREVNVVSHENADGSNLPARPSVMLVLPDNGRQPELVEKMYGKLAPAPPMMLATEAEVVK
jgi:hypothetical protein